MVERHKEAGNGADLLELDSVKGPLTPKR